VGHVLVEHNTVQNFALFEETTWDLFDLGVSLDIDFDEFALLSVDGLDCLDSEVDDEVAPLGGELGADAAAHDLLEILLIFDVDIFLYTTHTSTTYPEALGDLDDFVEGLEVGAHDHGRVDVTLDETLHGG
jgi:hypothetical protein